MPRVTIYRRIKNLPSTVQWATGVPEQSHLLTLFPGQYRKYADIKADEAAAFKTVLDQASVANGPIGYVLDSRDLDPDDRRVEYGLTVANGTTPNSTTNYYANISAGRVELGTYSADSSAQVDLDPLALGLDSAGASKAGLTLADTEGVKIRWYVVRQHNVVADTESLVYIPMFGSVAAHAGMGTVASSTGYLTDAEVSAAFDLATTRLIASRIYVDWHEIGRQFLTRTGGSIGSTFQDQKDALATKIDTSLLAVLETDTSTAAMQFVIDEDNMVSNLDTKVPTQQSVKAYVDSVSLGLYDHKGGYNAATNTPDLDTAPAGVKKGDAYTVTAAGTFFTEELEAGDVIIADQDNPTLLTHWTRVQKNIDAATTTVKGIVELATDGENAPNVVVQGNDSRLSNARTPTAHATSHTDGSDDIQSASALQKGLMTTAYATKLDGIEAGAEVTSLAKVTTALAVTATAAINTSAGAGDAGKLAKLDAAGLWNLNMVPVIDATKHGNLAGGALHADAVAGVSAGFQSAADKTKLDGIEAGAEVTSLAKVTTALAVTAATAVVVSAGAGDDGKLAKLDPNGRWDISTMPESAIKESTVALSTANILALHTTPIELVPTPAAGLYNEFLSATIRATKNATALNDALALGNLRIKTGTSTQDLAITEADGVVDVAAGTVVRHVLPAAPGATQNFTAQQESIVIDNDGGAFTDPGGADTTMSVTTRYRVLSLV